jgi:hypothetical protein
MLEGFYPLEARQQQVALTHLFPLLLGEDSIHCCTAQSETSAQGRPFHGPGGVPDEGVRALAETDRVASLTPGACEVLVEVLSIVSTGGSEQASASVPAALKRQSEAPSLAEQIDRLSPVDQCQSGRNV